MNELFPMREMYAEIKWDVMNDSQMSSYYSTILSLS